VNGIVILLTAALGAVVGTSAGLLILYRRLRPPITEGQLAELKGKLRTGESSLAAANANLEDLRKQLAFQERTIVQADTDLKKRQELLDHEVAERQKERTRRVTAEQTVEDLSSKLVSLKEQCTKLEVRAVEDNRIAAEKSTRLATVEAELEGAKRKAQELTEQAAHLISESADIKRSNDQEVRLRTALELQLKADEARIMDLADQVSELRKERSQLEIKLQEERGSAAKGMELLLAAQEKLSSVFRALGAEAAQNGHRTQAPAEVVAPAITPSPETKPDSSELTQPATASV